MGKLNSARNIDRFPAMSDGFCRENEKANMKILIVENERHIADALAFGLRRVGADVVLAYDGVTGLEAWHVSQPDLIILAVNLPHMDGFKVCRHIRAQSSTPIIMLAARDNDEDVVRGLELGADDYVMKPISAVQLMARVRAILRRIHTPLSHARLTVGNFTVDASRREVIHQGKAQARLTQLEYRLLEALAAHLGQVLPAERLISNVWGVGGGDKKMLKQLMHRLRRKIETHDSYVQIETVSGVGYALSPVTPAARIHNRSAARVSDASAIF